MSTVFGLHNCKKCVFLIFLQCYTINSLVFSFLKSSYVTAFELQFIGLVFFINFKYLQNKYLKLNIFTYLSIITPFCYTTSALFNLKEQPIFRLDFRLIDIKF